MRALRRHVTGLNPLVLMAFGVGSLVGSLFVRDLADALWALAAYGLVAVVFLPGWRYAAACLALGAVPATAVGYSTWRVGGHDAQVAVVAALRIVVLAWPGSVAIGYLDPARLGDYAAQSLRLPARPVAAVSAALQRFAGFGDDWTQAERVRRMRGLSPGASPARWFAHSGRLAFAVLASALRGASRTSIAMDARGFADAADRTWAEPATWSRADRLALLLAAALALVPLLHP